MKRVVRFTLAAIAVVGCFLSMGCSGAPVDETKPVEAKTGPQQPVAAGATGAPASASKSGAAQAN